MLSNFNSVIFGGIDPTGSHYISMYLTAHLTCPFYSVASRCNCTFRTLQVPTGARKCPVRFRCIKNAPEPSISFGNLQAPTIFRNTFGIAEPSETFCFLRAEIPLTLLS